MPSWPEGVPRPVAYDGRSRTGPQDAVIRQNMDAGPPKSRRRTTAATFGFRGQTPGMTRAQLQDFDEWVRDDIALGALSFDFVCPFDGLAKTAKLIDYEVVTHGTGCRVRVTLEYQP